VHWYVIPTLVLFQPFTGGGDKVAVMARGALSVAKEMLVDAVFPALSVAVPLKTSLAPAVVTWIGAGQEAIPEPASAQAKVTVTGSVRTPLLPPDDDAADATMEGDVLSRLTVTDVLEVALPPATSTAVPVITCPAPSLVTVIGAGHVAMAKFASLQVKVTVTFVLFHPLAFGGGLTVAVMTGVADATVGVTEAVPLRLPV